MCVCMFVCTCVCLTTLARGIREEINICFKCDVYRKGLGEEREVEAESWNALEEDLLGGRKSPQRAGLFLWLPRQQTLTQSGPVEGQAKTGAGLDAQEGLLRVRLAGGLGGPEGFPEEKWWV